MDESLSKAIKHISDRLLGDADLNRLDIVEEASKKYDLSPMQHEQLISKYVMGK